MLMAGIYADNGAAREMDVRCTLDSPTVFSKYSSSPWFYCRHLFDCIETALTKEMHLHRNYILTFHNFGWLVDYPIGKFVVADYPIGKLVGG